MTLKMKLSTQAVGSIMMALQKGLVAVAQGKPEEECDITKILTRLEIEDSVDGLIVLNPPVVEFDSKEEV